MKVSFIVPCYNEEGNVGLFCEQARAIMGEYEYELVFVNDGSKDDTITTLKRICNERKDNLTIVNFSRNFGKEAAIYAGLKKSTGEYSVIIDADLQQPIETAKQMVEFLDSNKDYDVVAAYQDERIEGVLISFLKESFYNIINKMCDVEMRNNASDFRCLRRNVVDAILNITEYHRFSKGIFAWVGFNTYFMPYKVRERNAGTTSWSFFKLISYAIDGMISFSTKPLKIATSVGICTSFIAIIYMIVVIIQKLAFGNDVPGYPTLVTIILFLGGIILTFLGILGEYLARVHIEVKQRPIFIEKECLKCNKEK